MMYDRRDMPESEEYTVTHLDAFRVSCPRCGERSEVMLCRGQYQAGYDWMSAHSKKCVNPAEGDSFQ